MSESMFVVALLDENPCGARLNLAFYGSAVCAVELRIGAAGLGSSFTIARCANAS